MQVLMIRSSAILPKLHFRIRSGCKGGYVSVRVGGLFDNLGSTVISCKRLATSATWIPGSARQGIYIALAHAAIGNKDQAFVWLTKSYESRDPQIVWLKVEPQFETLRPDPRFQALLRRMGISN